MLRVTLRNSDRTGSGGANAGREGMKEGHATTRREHSRRDSWRHFFGQRAGRITNRDRGVGAGKLLIGANTGRDEVN